MVLRRLETLMVRQLPCISYMMPTPTGLIARTTIGQDCGKVFLEQILALFKLQEEPVHRLRLHQELLQLRVLQ